MASLWFLKLILKCIDHLSWPTLALGYPLCASIEAIENDSHSDTRNLISYWILLSLIYLFEYAFLKLLCWFQYWNYMKLMIIAFLVIPDFGRAFYVYNELTRLCISMNLQAVISRFKNWKKMFVEKEDFLMQSEKFISEIGTESLEKLIASKNPEPNLVAETKKAAQTTEKNETQKINKARLHMEHKETKDLEMIEKDEVSSGKHANTASCSLKSKKKKSSAVAKTEGILATTVTEVGASAQSSTCKNVQKEWTCAICQVRRSSEANLKSHYYGKKHKAALEALKAITNKNHKSNGVDDDDTKVPELQKDIGMNHFRLRCEMCNVNCGSFVNLAAHLRGRKHLAQTQ